MLAKRVADLEAERVAAMQALKREAEAREVMERKLRDVTEGQEAATGRALQLQQKAPARAVFGRSPRVRCYIGPRSRNFR